MQAGSGNEIGVDIGGTFTDIVCRQSDGRLRILKVPSTRDNPSRAVLQAIGQLRKAWDVEPRAITRFVHGTTVATNAVLERRGAKIGLITTQGFKDILEIGRQMRHQMYDLILEPETPAFLAPGALRKEVRERISAQGEVLAPLDEAALVGCVDELLADRVEAVAVCFLFSFLNPRHELRARELIRERYPDLMISLSCEVDPAFREYERTVVTAFDAYLKPVVDRYLQHLEHGLREEGIPAPLQVMQSRGGVSAASVARLRPVRLFLSGPAAGVIGGRIVGQIAGASDLISVDVGGTSCDIALVRRGKPLIRAEGRIAGFPVRVPMVDVNAIGSGGGSVAWLDGAGGLRVGPHSAGSEPGPACYGRGGEQPTVTDASVVLGYLDPDYFAGGVIRLQPHLAQRIIAEKVAGPLGMSVEEAALGIHRVVNAQMAEGIRLVSIRQGFDPRGFTLVPLGGAGPLHATPLARELKIGRIVVPRYPGVLSAAGLLAAPVEHEASAAYPRTLAKVTLDEVRAALDGLDRRCGELMAAEAVSPAEVRISYFADVCYIGQSYHLEVPLHLGESAPLERLYRDFMVEHDRIYGHSTESPARIVNLRSIHQAGGLALSDVAYEATGANPLKGHRMVRLPGIPEPVEAAIYDRPSLPEGFVVLGPAICEQEDTTTLIEPGWRAEMLAGGSLLLAPQT